MRLPIKVRDIPIRVATGAYIAHSGWDKWHGGPEHAAGIHGAASGAYPFLGSLPPEKFLRGLAAGEMTLGGVLLTPFVRSRFAGAALAAFSGALLTLYWRTPGMRKPGSVWPSQAGTAVSKDVWMFGIGLSLVAGDLADDD